MAELFSRDYKTIRKHINNALKEELNNEVVVAKFENTTTHGAIEGKTQTHMIDYYNLDMIISVGYDILITFLKMKNYQKMRYVQNLHIPLNTAV